MKIRIISSNIRFDNPKDDRNSWDYRKELLSRILRGHSPDLIGTQEGRKPQLLELAELLRPNYKLIDHHRDWILERMYPCIYSNQQTIEWIESGDFWLSLTPAIPGSFSFDSTFPRLTTWMKGRFKENHKEFFFANLHLDHILSVTRVKQMEVFIHEIKKINKQNLPLILSGDFNEGPEGDVRKILQNHLPNLYDPWQSLGLQERTSHHHFDNSSKSGSRIDWILVDKNFSSYNIFFDESCENNLYPSDHFPLITDINF